MANRYMKVGGSNLLDGTTLANAWETPAYGAANVGAQNTLNVADGTYQTKNTDWSTIADGVSGTYTTVKAINPKQVIFILTTGQTFSTRVMQLPSECHYIEFNGLIIDGDNRSGDCVHLGGSNASTHIRFDNCTFRNTGHNASDTVGGMGIQMSSATNCEVLRCTFKDINAYGIYNQNGPNTFSQNTFDTCEKIGITAHSNGLTYTGVVIERNLFYNCGYHPVEPNYAVILSSSQHTASTVRNNIFWACRRGLVVSSNSHTIVNNAFYDNGLTGLLWTSTSLTIRNNIALGNGTNFSGSATSNTLSDNIITGTATDYWINPSIGDFHLNAGEPTTSDIVGQGTTVSGVTIDFDGVTRTDPPDIGPYQRSGSVAVTPINVISSLSTAVNVAASFEDFNVVHDGDLDNVVIYAEEGSFD